MSQILYSGFFLIFLGMVIVLRSAKSPTARHRLVTLLVLYILLVHVALTVARRDAWPFAVHALFLEKGDDRRPFSTIRFVGVDRFGREHRIDPNSWSPIHDRTLEIWWLINFKRLNADARQRLLGFLLEKAEIGRRLRATGGSIGPSRLLRFAAAPFWYSMELSPQPAESPFVRFRAYQVTRVPARKLSDGSESTQLLTEFAR